MCTCAGQHMLTSTEMTCMEDFDAEKEPDRPHTISLLLQNHETR